MKSSERILSARKRNIRVFLIIAGILTTVLFSIWFLISQNSIIFGDIIPRGVRNDILRLWNGEEYDELIEVSTRYLEGNTFDQELLFLRGISHYYSAQNEISFEQQTVEYNQTITDLRKALLFADETLVPQIHYMLGKTYYHKGYYYFDSAYHHLKTAEALDFHQPDSFEYLGLVSSELGNITEGIEYLSASHEENGRAIILLTIARMYSLIEDYDSSLEYANLAYSTSLDSFEQEQALLIAGSCYRSQSRWDDAEAVYQRLFELNNHSADAKFYLGEIYAAKGDPVQARVYWREAYAINPRHPGAISRLNS